MEHYLTLKIVHSALGAVLLLGVLAHIFMLFKAARSGDAAILQRKLGRTRRLSMPLQGLVALLLPLSGWWLVHLAGFSLGQLWLLVSSILMLVLVVLYLLLAGRLRAWAEGVASAPRWAAAYAILIGVVLLAVFALMGAKPL